MDIQAKAEVPIDGEYNPDLFRQRLGYAIDNDSISEFTAPIDSTLIPYAKRTVDSMPNYLPEWASSFSEFRVSGDYVFPHFLIVKTVDPSSTPAWGGDISMSGLHVNTLSKGKVMSHSVAEWATSNVTCPSIDAHLGITSGDYYTYFGSGSLEVGDDINTAGGAAGNFHVYMHSSTKFMLDGKPLASGVQVRNRAAYIENPGHAIVRTVKFQKTTSAGEKELTKDVNITRHRYLDENKLRRYHREFMGDTEMFIREFDSGFTSSKQTGGATFFEPIMNAGTLQSDASQTLKTHFDKTIEAGTHTQHDEETYALREGTAYGSICAPREECPPAEIFNLMMTSDTMNPWHHMGSFSFAKKSNHMKFSFSSKDEVIRVWPSKVLIQTHHTLMLVVGENHTPVQEYTHSCPAMFSGSVVTGGTLKKSSLHHYVVHFSYRTNILVSYCSCLDFFYDTFEEDMEVGATSTSLNFNTRGQGLNCPVIIYDIVQRSEGTTQSYVSSSSWMDSGQVVVTPHVKKTSGVRCAGGPIPLVDNTTFIDALQNGRQLEGKLFPESFTNATAHAVFGQMVDLTAPKTYWVDERVTGVQYTAKPVLATMSVKMNSSAVQSTVPAQIMGMLNFLNPDCANTIAKHRPTMPFDHRENAPRRTVAGSGPHLPKSPNIVVYATFSEVRSALTTPITIRSQIFSKNYMETAAGYESELFA